MEKKIEQECRKLFEIATKKGTINEEDIYFRLLKYEATADEINDIIKQMEENGIKVKIGRAHV